MYLHIIYTSIQPFVCLSVCLPVMVNCVCKTTGLIDTTFSVQMYSSKRKKLTVLMLIIPDLCFTAASDVSYLFVINSWLWTLLSLLAKFCSLLRAFLFNRHFVYRADSMSYFKNASQMINNSLTANNKWAVRAVLLYLCGNIPPQTCH